MSKLLRIYIKSVEKHPYLTQCTTAGALTALGDCFAQHLFSTDKYDYTRTLKFAAIGTFYFGPICTGWLRFLSSKLEHKPMAMMAVDQVLAAPLITVGFLAIFTKMNGLNNFESIETIKNEFWGIQTKSWPFWMSVQAINFRFMPLAYRVLFIQVASILWNTYLSWKASSAVKIEEVVVRVEDLELKHDKLD